MVAWYIRDNPITSVTCNADPLRSLTRPQVSWAAPLMEPVWLSLLMHLRSAEGGPSRLLSSSPASAGTARLCPTCSPVLARPAQARCQERGDAQSRHSTPSHVSLTEAGLGQDRVRLLMGGLGTTRQRTRTPSVTSGGLRTTRQRTRTPSVTSGGAAQMSVLATRVGHFLAAWAPRLRSDTPCIQECRLRAERLGPGLWIKNYRN